MKAIHIIGYAVLVVSLTGTAAAQSDTPKRKSGLWDVSVKAQGESRAMRFQECVDQKSDDFMKPEAMDDDMKCDKGRVRREGQAYVLEANCKIDGSTVKSRAVYSGNFDSAYKVDVKSSYTPPYQGVREASAQMEGRWVGPCKPGQKPGDVVMPGMPNMDELMKGKKR